MSRISTNLYRFFEWVPLGSAGLFVAIISLLSREIEFVYWGMDVPFLIAIFLIVILVILLIGKRFVPRIGVYSYDTQGNKINLSELEEIDAHSGSAEIDLHFDVPDHHNEVYVHFDIDSYVVGIEQYTPVNYDMSNSITCYSDIHSFDLTLKLTPADTETNRGSRIPLKIIDKLHSRNVGQILVNG